MGPKIVFAALLLPIAIVVPLALLEVTLTRDTATHAVSDEQRMEIIGKASDVTMENIKLLITLATAILGGVAYYAKNNQLFSGGLRKPWPLAASASVAAILSIFFGHLEVTALRNQLALGVEMLDVRAGSLIWPERLQYCSFLLALSWFGLLAFGIEFNRGNRTDDPLGAVLLDDRERGRGDGTSSDRGRSA